MWVSARALQAALRTGCARSMWTMPAKNISVSTREKHTSSGKPGKIGNAHITYDRRVRALAEQCWARPHRVHEHTNVQRQLNVGREDGEL